MGLQTEEVKGLTTCVRGLSSDPDVNAQISRKYLEIRAKLRGIEHGVPGRGSEVLWGSGQKRNESPHSANQTFPPELATSAFGKCFTMSRVCEDSRAQLKMGKRVWAHTLTSREETWSERLPRYRAYTECLTCYDHGR